MSGLRAGRRVGGGVLAARRLGCVPRAMESHHGILSERVTGSNLFFKKITMVAGVGKWDGEVAGVEVDRLHYEVFISFLLDDFDEHLALDEVRKLQVITERLEECAF